MIHRFHYLTQDLPDISHQELIETACRNGVRWVQLRVKNSVYTEWLQIAYEAKEICDAYNAVLIVNDNVLLAKEVNASGVHVGKHDMEVAAARELLGKDKIIGATANTLEDVLQHQRNGADYVGLGPFRVTVTKKNLSPVLGLKGYQEILGHSLAVIEIPVIAIGGIQLSDVQSLLQTDVHGIAVSSVINLTEDKAAVISAFLAHLS